MNFKGTEGISREDLKVWIERAGGAWNGYTWIDQTTYFETLSSDALDLALRIESERMTSCIYKEDEFESERSVIIAELQGNQNNPAYLLGVDVAAEAFRTHPYGWPTIGRLSDLETMSRDDLYNHYRNYYCPNNATLVIVGDIEPNEVLRGVQQYFGSIERGNPPPGVKTREPEQKGERRVSVERPGTTRYLDVAFHAPAVGDEDFVTLLVADAILSGGKGINLWAGGFGRDARTTSPLYQALVETELVAAVSSALLPTEQPYLYSISATVRDSISESAVEDALFTVLDSLASQISVDHTLQKAKNQLLTQLAFDDEGVTRIGHQLGYFSTIADWKMIFEIEKQINSVTAENIRDVVARRLVSSRRTVGWFRPQALQ
jgi:zinc protease